MVPFDDVKLPPQTTESLVREKKYLHISALSATDGLITDKQRRALELVVARSVDATELGKKAVIWLLRQSHDVSRNVVATFSAQQGAKQIADSVHDMLSSGGSTHLGERIALMGVRFWISSHGGSFPITDELRSKIEGVYTIWVSSRSRYDHDAEILQVDMNAIQAVSLTVDDICGKEFYT